MRQFAKLALPIAILLGLTASHARDAVRGDLEITPPNSCATPLEPAQTSNDVRGCCILVTDKGPRCAYTSRGYCSMRAAQAGVQFEFHEVASCSELPQCR